jgi:hypothetical protein
MTAHTIYIANTTSECGSFVEENITTTGCTNYILRLNPNTNAYGPFDITIITNSNIDSYTGITSAELIKGYNISLNCP